MVYLTKTDVDKIVRELSNSSSKKIKSIIKRLKSPEKRKVYVRDKSEIRNLLQKAFDEKRKVKIRYYGLHSDEFTTKIIDIYQIHINSIIAFCHLRDEERTFAVERINSATILDEKYAIPKNWSPESIIIDK
ncbi:MAG: WYL domain-containing protein [Nanoarchaeota archaeon]|nr:WYL domain-containing protein [Nanoarchaeota archaeon]